jgi:hypothetical protein
MTDGTFVIVDLRQTGNQLTGGAAFQITGSRNVYGSVNGNFLEFTVPWARTDMVGVYTGAIDGQGRIGGTTFDRNHPKNTAGWRGDRVAKCIVASTAPPPVNTAPPKALGRVTAPPGASPTTSLSICDRARDARARNSPTAPALEAQCRATAADLSVVSVSGPSPLRAGLSGTYTVIIKNSGNVSAAIDLHIVFAKALDQTGQIVAGAGLACAIGHDAGINTGLTCTGGQLAAGATTTVTVQGRGQTAGVGILLATINPSHVAQESNYDNNMYQLNVTIN